MIWNVLLCGASFAWNRKISNSILIQGQLLAPRKWFSCRMKIVARVIRQIQKSNRFQIDRKRVSSMNIFFFWATASEKYRQNLRFYFRATGNSLFSSVLLSAHSYFLADVIIQQKIRRQLSLLMGNAISYSKYMLSLYEESMHGETQKCTGSYMRERRLGRALNENWSS